MAPNERITRASREMFRDNGQDDQESAVDALDSANELPTVPLNEDDPVAKFLAETRSGRRTDTPDERRQRLKGQGRSGQTDEAKDLA